MQDEYDFIMDEKILTAILSESDLQKLLNILLKKFTANSISFEDIPVDDAMRNFFQNPKKYIK